MLVKKPRPPIPHRPSSSSSNTLVGSPLRPAYRRQTTHERMAEREQWFADQISRAGRMVRRMFKALGNVANRTTPNVPS